MTERLYYENSFLYNFTASVESVRELPGGRRALLLDQSAFYPSGGGQPFDTGWIELLSQGSDAPAPLTKLRVAEVLEDAPDGNILHIVEGLAEPLSLPLRVRGFLDVERRQDHMQQHSGQHLLSAAFRKLYGAFTRNFQLGEETCSLEVEIDSLDSAKLAQAELFANRCVWEDRQVLMHEVTREQAEKLGLAHIPGADRATHRLIEIRGVDLAVCGGTHVKTTGQIGHIQLRRTGRLHGATRVVFLCGLRALRQARRDFELLDQQALTGQVVTDRVLKDNVRP